MTKFARSTAYSGRKATTKITGQVLLTDGPLDALHGDIGLPVVPVGGVINIQGGATGAISFSNGGFGQLDAAVQVDNTTITIVGNQLVASGALPVQYFSLQTINGASASTPDIILPDNQVSQVQVSIAYMDTGVTVGGGVLLSSAVIEIGGVFTLLNALDELSLNESPALALTDYAYIAGGAASTMKVQVTGVVPYTINWRVGVTIISTP